MPRNKQNPSEFIAGMLPTITFNKEKYFVDGRLQEIRHTKDFMKKLDTDDDVWEILSKKDQKIITFEFYGM